MRACDTGDFPRAASVRGPGHSGNAFPYPERGIESAGLCLRWLHHVFSGVPFISLRHGRPLAFGGRRSGLYP